MCRSKIFYIEADPSVFMSSMPFSEFSVYVSWLCAGRCVFLVLNIFDGTCFSAADETANLNIANIHSTD